MAKRVVLKASDVAAIIGRHQYKPRDEVFNDYWKKYSPDTFTGQTKKEKALEALGASESAQKILESALAFEAKDSKEAAQTFENAKTQVNLDTKLSVYESSFCSRLIS